MRLPIVFVGLLVGCDDYIFGEQVVDEATVPQVEGIEGVREIVDLNCLGCHSAEQALGGLDLETDIELDTIDVVGQYSVPIVLPGDPENSMFYLKITNAQDGRGADMPPGSGGLSTALADIVYDWIVSLEAPVE